MNFKLPVFSGVAAALLSLPTQAQPTEDNELPNIVIFIADDASMDFGCYGNPVVKTPNIDKLAQQGLLFEQAFVTAPQCSPCRTSILSGKFAHTIGTEDLHVGIQDSTVLLPTYLKEAGYFTALMLKSHIGDHGTDQFDWFDSQSIWPDYYGTGVYNDRMMDEFRDVLDTATQADKPLFLWMGFVDPHRPYTEDKAIKNRAPEVHDPKKVIVPPYLDDNDSTRVDIAHYYDEIHRLDSHIGWMMDELDKRNELDNTIIIFFSDNGMPFPRAKMTCYDSGIHTPLIVYWKNKIKAGTTYSGLTSLIDLSPTLLDLIGQPVPKDMYGKSLKPALFDQSTPGRDYIFAERNKHGAYDYIRAIRTNRYKLIINGITEDCLHCDEHGNLTGREMRRRLEQNLLDEQEMRCYITPEPPVELFDLKKDPHEFDNLAGKRRMRKQQKTLMAELLKWQKQTNDHEPDRNKIENDKH